jgi:Protein of unknown function (DUF4019)
MRIGVRWWGRWPLFACLMVSLLLPACAGPLSIYESYTSAAAAVDRFHSQFNAGRFAAIYDAADPEFKASTNKADFTQLLDAVHRKLGAFEAEKQVHFSQGWTMRQGTLVTLDYETTYAQGKAREHFVWRPRNSDALLVEYRVDSRALIVR